MLMLLLLRLRLVFTPGRQRIILHMREEVPHRHTRLRRAQGIHHAHRLIGGADAIRPVQRIDHRVQGGGVQVKSHQLLDGGVRIGWERRQRQRPGPWM